MALADIEKRIISDAEREAADILSIAQKHAREKLSAVRNALAADKKKIVEKLADEEKQHVEQHAMLLKLENAQSILKTKRVQLHKLQTELVEDIINDDASLIAFYKKSLAQIKVHAEKAARLIIAVSPPDEKIVTSAAKTAGIACSVKSQKTYERGQCVCTIDKAQVDLSLKNYVFDYIKAKEMSIAEELFA